MLHNRIKKEIEIRETKLEEEKVEIEPNHMKPKTHAQYLEKNENILLTSTKSEILLQISTKLIQFLSSDIIQNMWLKIVNMDATNQKEATVIMATNAKKQYLLVPPAL
ncbi:27291_t:CDS:2 [Gigaspora margarita]|uniref:27291_t:CDS:1 n=1 Tax=Gigaspora margarita TaxID=4874 RepID=A0ABN7VWK0_GIGMA|nr:27291_t:CDS:2 [Gigaspora margarita]